MSASDNVAIEIEGTEVAQVPESARSVVFPLADGVPEEAYPPYLLKTQLEVRDAYIDLEWRQREMQPHIVPTDTTDVASLPYLRTDTDLNRDRYQNITPYEHNRFELRAPGDVLNDYINASPVSIQDRDGKARDRFLATQGPKLTTIAHFWHMVYTCNAYTTADSTQRVVVIMLTKFAEAGREKCLEYLPSDVEMPCYWTVEANGTLGPSIQGYRLLLKSCEWDESTGCTVRHLQISQLGNVVDADVAEEPSREVTHFAYEVWPDFGVPEPEDRRHILNLADTVRALADEDRAERIIHCSAGVGRTGTFIALYSMLRRLRREREGGLERGAGLQPREVGRDDIYEEVLNLRQQRWGMVQGETQYGFIYDSVREAFEEHFKGES